MSNDNAVPKITVSGFMATSNSTLPAVTADTCACWDGAEFEKAKKLLRYGTEVQCNDATAYCAVTSLALELLMKGKTVKAKIVKNW
jgi:hypothetical protein